MKENYVNQSADDKTGESQGASEKQNAANVLKELAEKVRREKYDEKPDVKEVAIDIFSVAFMALLGFGWMMLMLLLLSFISLGYLHFDIEKMVLVSILTGVLLGVLRLIKMVRKYSVISSTPKNK